MMTLGPAPAALLHRLGRAPLVAALCALALRAPVALAAEHADEEVDGPELVAEALFLCDTLPPGGRDLNLSLEIARDAADPVTGDAPLALSPRVQAALALGERTGLTVDVGLGTDGAVLAAPAASLKILLRDPAAGRTGLAASLDLFGPTHSLSETEAGVGLGAIRAVGAVALRGSVSVASAVHDWSPHLHAGLSAALALGGRWRALVETVADAAGGEVLVSAGPTLKLAVDDRTSAMAGALFPLAQPGATPTFVVQLARSL